MGRKKENFRVVFFADQKSIGVDGFDMGMEIESKNG